MTQEGIRHLIERNKIDFAIKELVRIDRDLQYRNQLSFLTYGFNKLNDDCIKGKVSKQEEDVHRSRIINSLFEIVSLIFDEYGSDSSGGDRHRKQIIYTRNKRKIKTENQVMNAKASIRLLSEIPSTFFAHNISSYFDKILSEKTGEKDYVKDVKIIMLSNNEFSRKYIESTNPYYSDKRKDRCVKKDMKKVIENYKQLTKQSKGKINIEMRQWEGVIISGILITDHEIREKSECRVEPRLYKSFANNRMNMYFYQQDFYYKEYFDQFEKIWAESTPITIEQSST